MNKATRNILISCLHMHRFFQVVFVVESLDHRACIISAFLGKGIFFRRLAQFRIPSTAYDTPFFLILRIVRLKILPFWYVCSGISLWFKIAFPCLLFICLLIGNSFVIYLLSFFYFCMGCFYLKCTYTIFLLIKYINLL